MEMTLNNGFCEMTGNEMLAVDGGDPARNAMVAAHRQSGGTRMTEAEKKMVTCYTLGYLSAATWWCPPVSLGLGITATLYGCQ